LIVATTGASARVGRATAHEFAARGWDVALLARGQECLDAAAAEISGCGVRALPISADAADFPAMEDAPRQSVHAYGGRVSVHMDALMATRGIARTSRRMPTPGR
jgi:NADP-dependent 3-hydroxy acid dehydrogenase YdfG